MTRVALPSTADRAAIAPWSPSPALRASALLHVGAAVAAAVQPAWALGALGAVVADHAVLTAAGLWPRSTLLGPNVRRLPAAAARAGAVNVSFDDGPDPHVTPELLDLLAAHGLRATFFCIADRVRAHPALARRIVAAGHDVQNHSCAHRATFSLHGWSRLKRELADAQAMLADVTGQWPHAFRAPAGLRSPLLDPLLHAQGLHLVSWTRRGFDTREGDPGRVLGRLTRGLAAGDLLLLHDGHAARTAAGRAVALDVVPRLAQALDAAGLHGVTLREALPPRGRVG